jgi:photosynthetic reaction center H subunit
MSTGAITPYIDVAQVTLYAFWVFFAGLIYYLLRENKREGYPLESDRSGSIDVQGWPAVPEPKTYKLQHGGTVNAPSGKRSAQPLAAEPSGSWGGAPLLPTGNPMLDGVGPGAWADRADVADMTFEGLPKIVPLRVDGSYSVSSRDPDPRGMPVMGADGVVGGTVVDLWVDRSDILFRYLELDVPVGQAKRRVLLPVNFCRIGERHVTVKSILGPQFADVPGTRHAEQVTFLEEEKIMAYYGGGTLYATPQRQEPWL